MFRMSGLPGELTDFVLNSRSCLLRISLAVVRELASARNPSQQDLSRDQLTFLRYALSVYILFTPSKRRVRVLEERKKRVREDVLHTCAPCVFPNLLEGRHEAGHHEVALIIPHVLHDIERNRLVEVERCESIQRP